MKAGSKPCKGSAFLPAVVVMRDCAERIEVWNVGVQHQGGDFSFQCGLLLVGLNSSMSRVQMAARGGHCVEYGDKQPQAVG